MNRYRLRAGALALACMLFLLSACQPAATSSDSGTQTTAASAGPAATGALPGNSGTNPPDGTDPATGDSLPTGGASQTGGNGQVTQRTAATTRTATQTTAGGGSSELPPAKVIYKDPQPGSLQTPGKLKELGADGKNLPDYNNLIDYSHVDQGYFMAKSTGETSRMRVAVYKDAARTVLLADYPLPSDNKWQVFPLQFGLSEYTVRILRNTTGNKYEESATKTFNVSLADSFLPYLYPTQWTDFRKELAPETHALSGKLTRGMTTDLQKIQAIYEWMVDKIKYDYKKAATATADYRPSPDKTISDKTGICSDYAALMGAMLRLQGIPTKFVYGTVNGAAHAWNSVYTREKGWITFKIEFTGGAWKLMDATYGVAKGDTIDTYIKSNKYTQITDY